MRPCRNVERDQRIRQMNTDGFDVAVIAHEVGASPNAVRLVLRRSKAGARETPTKRENVLLNIHPEILKDLRTQADNRAISHRELACQIVHAVIKRGLVRQVLDEGSK